MIKINFKYALIAFLILVISSCAIVLLTINSNDESSSIKLITSVSQDSETGESTEKSQESKNNTADTKESKKKTENRTIKRSTLTSSPKKTTTTATSIKFPLDINKATKDELMQIDGVGEVTAKKILSYRKKIKYYSNLLQLMDINGIGEATYEKLRDYLYVSGDKFKDFEGSSKVTKITTSKTTKAKTTKVKTTKCKTSKSSSKTTEAKQMKVVNINTASKEEIIECLLLDEEQVENIIDLRNRIGGQFTNSLELMYIIGKSEYNRVKDYITF